MKKILQSMLVMLALMASIGFELTANAQIASADEGITDSRGTLTAEGDGIAILGGKGMVDITGNGILWVKDLEVVDIKELLDHCQEIFSIREKEKGLSLRAEIEQLTSVIGDIDRLKQVFNNLLDNTLKHASANGEVTITGPLIPSKSRWLTTNRVFLRKSSLMYSSVSTRPAGLEQAQA